MLEVRCQLGNPRSGLEKDSLNRDLGGVSFSGYSLGATVDSSAADQSKGAAENHLDLDSCPGRKILRVFRRNKSELLRMATAITGSTEIAEEVIQETYVKMLKRWNGAGYQDPVGYPDAYVLTAVTNTAVDYIRRQGGKRPCHFGDLPEDFKDKLNEIPIDESEEPLNRMLSAEGKKRLRRAINQLPERYKEAISAYLVEPEKSGRFVIIARKLGISPAAARTQVCRAKQMLRSLLEEV